MKDKVNKQTKKTHKKKFPEEPSREIGPQGNPPPSKSKSIRNTIWRQKTSKQNSFLISRWSTWVVVDLEDAPPLQRRTTTAKTDHHCEDRTSPSRRTTGTVRTNHHHENGPPSRRQTTTARTDHHREAKRDLHAQNPDSIRITWGQYFIHNPSGLIQVDWVLSRSHPQLGISDQIYPLIHWFSSISWNNSMWSLGALTTNNTKNHVSKFSPLLCMFPAGGFSDSERSSVVFCLRFFHRSFAPHGLYL